MREARFQKSLAAKEANIIALQEKVKDTKQYLETTKGQASISNVQLGVVTSELENTKLIAARLRETIDNLNQEHEDARGALVQKEQEISKMKASFLQAEINE